VPFTEFFFLKLKNLERKVNLFFDYQLIIIKIKCFFSLPEDKTLKLGVLPFRRTYIPKLAL
jgi:hypothetical protein